MTPKEKAEDLVNQYRMILMDEDTNCGNEILCSLIAIKNALIAVDQVIEQNNIWIRETGKGSNNYWNEVWKEIVEL